MTQPALFRHGGYGATLRTVESVCDRCHTAREVERQEVNPLR